MQRAAYQSYCSELDPYCRMALRREFISAILAE